MIDLAPIASRPPILWTGENLTLELIWGPKMAAIEFLYWLWLSKRMDGEAPETSGSSLCGLSVVVDAIALEYTMAAMIKIVSLSVKSANFISNL